MSLKFIGNHKKLEKCISRTGIPGKWRELDNRQQQYRTADGAVLNWSKKSGTVWFQGQKPAIPRLEREFIREATKKGLLEGAGDAVGEIADLRGVVSDIAKLKKWRKRMETELAELKGTVAEI